METRDGIRQFRDRMRLNQSELADKLGIVQGNITKWESGKGTMSFSVAKKLLEMGATVEELFGIEYADMHGYVKPEPVPFDLFAAVRSVEARVAALENK